MSSNIPDPPSKKRKPGYADLDFSSPAYLYSFYMYVEMDKWSDDCIQRIKDYSYDADTHGQELCRVFHRMILYYNSMEKSIAARKAKVEAEKAIRLAEGSNYDPIEICESPVSIAARKAKVDAEKAIRLAEGSKDDPIEICESPASIAASKARVDAEKAIRLAEGSKDDPIEICESPASPDKQGRSRLLHIDEVEIVERLEGGEEIDHGMEEIVEGGEQSESGDERRSASPTEMNRVVQPVERVKTAVISSEKNPIERNEERMERESSLFVIRRVLPRVPPVRQCKVELRDDREEERGPSATTTQSSAESTSHHAIPHQSMPSVVSPVKEAPTLRIKQEVPENPFVSLPDTPPMRAVTPPPLMIKMEPQTPTSAHSDHNYSAPPSTESQKRNATAAVVGASMIIPPLPPHPSFPSPPSLPLRPSPLPSTSAVDHPSTSFGVSLRAIDATTQKMLAAELEEISKQIRHVNGIKQTALEKGLKLGNLAAPLLSICSDGSPLSIDKFNSECRRVSDEVRSLEIQLDILHVPSEDYLRVSNHTVQEQIERIWKRVKKEMEETKEKKKTKRREGEKGTTPIKRKDPNVSRISSKAKELAARTAEKRARPDSILPAEKGETLKRRRIGERREDREWRKDDDEPTTSRGRRHDEMDMRNGDSRWCAFCSSSTSHTAINCSVYKSYTERQIRKQELKLCHHCLDVYDHRSCNRPEHKRQCPHCHRHTSHPALCKFLHKRGHLYDSDSSRSPDGKKISRKGVGSPRD